MDDAEGKAQKNPLGPAGARVTANVKRLRLAQGLTYKELSARLEQFGRPIPVLGLSRLEKGARRVDADDLVALALALAVTPNALLLPEAQPAAETATYPLTEQLDGRFRELWAWASGEVPLGEKPVSTFDDEAARRRELIFAVGNRPHHFGFGAASYLQALANSDLSPGLQVAAPAALGALLITVFAAGVTTSEIRDMVETSLISAVGNRPDEHPAEMQQAIRQLLKVLTGAGGGAG